MGDAIIISSIVISVLGAIAALFGKLKFKHCKSMCCESDCAPSSPSRSVSRQNSKKDLDSVVKVSQMV